MMFDKLLNIGLENITVPLSETPAPSDTPAQPPLKFGAIKIPLEKDPDQSQIKIIEIPNETNTNDYFVFINGGIRGDAAYYAEFVTLLETLTENSSVIIQICSPGGSLYTGATISSAISNSRASVTTIASGVVASAAALIWSYGNIRKVKDNSVILFHMSSHMDWGNSKEIQINAENTVQYVKEICIDPMVDQGLVTIDEAEMMIDKRRDLLIDAITMRSRLEIPHEVA